MQRGGYRGAAIAPPRYGDVPPNQTLYLNNLNEKIKVPELKCVLHELFSTYGEIVYRDISCATNALRALQNFVLLDKPVRIQYSKSKSDVISLEDGTFKPRASAKAKMGKEDLKKDAGPAIKRKGGPPPQTSAQASARFMAHPGAGPAAAPPGGSDQPSNVLFVENLPPEVNETMLTMLFRQYPGFQEARHIKGRNVAFIEYSDELQAGIAQHGLQGFMVTPDMALKIAFAKQ